MRKDHGRVRDTAAASIKHWGSELGCSVAAIRCCYRIVPAYMLLLHSLQDPMLGIGVLNVAPKPLSPLPSPSLPACCAVSLSRSCNFREDGDCADVYHSLIVAAMYRFFPVPARHVRSVPMHLRNHDRVSVPRLRKVAATIVDPATRCFNYSASLGGFR